MDWGQYEVVHGQQRNDFNSHACLSKLPKRSLGFTAPPASSWAGWGVNLLEHCPQGYVSSRGQSP